MATTPSRASARRTAVLAALLVAAGLVVMIAEGGAEDDDRCAQLPQQGEERVWPDGCWRPYADDSPFNRPIPPEPRLDERSDAIVRTITESTPGVFIAGSHDTPEDFNRPVYFASNDDPIFTVRCTRPWGRCDLENLRIRIPDEARPAAGGDGHLTVVDAVRGWEYDLWKVASKPKGGGELVAAWGGMTRLDGDGLGSAAVASNFGTLAGLIRPEELEAGEIRHALFMTTPCVARVSGRDHVYPATGQARPCEDDRAAPLLGARVQLAMTAEEIDALDTEPWIRTLLHAMARYGMYVGDTGGPPGWALQIQSDTSYTSLGRPPKLLQFARRARWPENVGDFSGAVDWRSRLRVVHPCVTAGTC